MFALVIDRAAHRRSSTGWSMAVVVLSALLLGDAATAQQKDAAYDVSVWSIRATTSNKEISPELKQIANELKKRFKYTGFKLERKKSGKAEERKAFATDLVAGFKAKVTPIERKGSRIKLKIEITKREGKKEKPLLNTTVGLNRGKFHLQGGWRIDSKSKDVLIVAVSAR